MSAYTYTGPPGIPPTPGLIPRDLSRAEYDALAEGYGERIMSKFWKPTKPAAAKGDDSDG